MNLLTHLGSGILCPTEDSSNCLWLAPLQGNHQGTSFLDLGGNLIPLSSDTIGVVMAGGLIAVLATIGIIHNKFRSHRTESK